MTIPTAAAQMVPFEDLATGAGAGPDIVGYLKARSLDRVPTLALIADKNEDVDRHVIQPYIDGHKDSQGTVHQAPTGEAPVARAILHHMWLEARRQWGIHSIITAPAMQTAPATSAPPGSTTGTGHDTTDEKVPKTFPQWAAQVEKYNRVTVNGERRRFPEAKLTGAEQILARVWHEHTKSKMYTPITLGEILAKRTFTATGEVNPLALPKTGQSASTTQALRLQGNELVATDDPQWVPRSMLAIMDGVEAARWAWIIVGIGEERAVHDYTDWFTTKARSRPHQLDQVREYWMAAGWRIAMAMRIGKTFKEAATDVMADHATFQEAMNTTGKTTGKPHKHVRTDNTDHTSYPTDDQPDPSHTKGKGKRKYGGKANGGKKGKPKGKYRQEKPTEDPWQDQWTTPWDKPRWSDPTDKKRTWSQREDQGQQWTGKDGGKR